MDSINSNQPERNRQDLQGDAAIRKVKEIVEQAQNCFFCTASLDGSQQARPMNVRQVDAEGNLWFLSAKDSHKNDDLNTDSLVRLFFQASHHSGFLQLDGRASVSTDRKKIEELWEPILRTWFTEGVNDPRVTAIKVKPVGGYYWDTKHGNLVAGIKMLLGAMVGKTLDDSIEGSLKCS